MPIRPLIVTVLAPSVVSPSYTLVAERFTVFFAIAPSLPENESPPDR
jgi:hypothetical protein